MKIAITVPQFRHDPGPAIAAAIAADELGLAGVFVFDHLWAIGQPGRPALPAFPLLGALAASTSQVALGTLVARIGLWPDDVLLRMFLSLQLMIGDRLIAGVGTGDRLSKAENLAYGIEFPPALERRQRVGIVCDQLRAAGIVTWVGGKAKATRQVAVDHADAINLWDVDPAELAAEAGSPVTWGGPVPADHSSAVALLTDLAAAGATWAVCAPPYRADSDPVPHVAALAEAATQVRA